MKTFSFYDLNTGLFTTRRFRTSNSTRLELNTPDGTSAMEGQFDPRTQRVNLETGEVVAYQAEPDAQQARDQAQARIAKLERKQERPVRELFLDPDNVEARKRLEAIDAEIAALRVVLARIRLAG